MEDASLSALALQLVRTGELPNAVDAAATASHSDGDTCALCGDDVVPGAEVVELAWVTSGTTQTIRLHPACHRCWLAATRNHLETTDD